MKCQKIQICFYPGWAWLKQTTQKLHRLVTEKDFLQEKKIKKMENAKKVKSNSTKYGDEMRAWKGKH